MIDLLFILLYKYFIIIYIYLGTILLKELYCVKNCRGLVSF